MKDWRNIALLSLAVALAVMSLVAFTRGGGEEPAPSPKSVKVSRPGDAVKKGRAKQASNVSRVADRADLEARREKPTFAIDDDDEANLTETQRALIEAIRAALDAEDFPRLLSLVQKMQASEEWPDGIPKSIKLAAIDALGWFKAKGLPEIAGFFADLDPEVVANAIERYEEALSDMDISDRERSTILVEAAKLITDADALDSMMFEVNNMRHSVAVATFKEIMESGNGVAKGLISETIESYTLEEGLDTPEKLEKWLAENPDDEDDEDFYGGSKGDDE